MQARPAPIAARRSPARAEDPDEREVAAVLEGVRRVVRVLRVSSRATEQRLGVSGAQLFVLQQLAQAPARSLNELAERTHTDQSSVSVVVSRLVERGLVSRDISVEDSRRITISLTSAGRTVLRHAPEAAQARLVEALRRLPRTQLTGLARGLSSLGRLMNEGNGDGAARGARRAH
jgi:DNA-binding MarR family transcriptional regulator